MLHGISTLVLVLVSLGLWFRSRRRAMHLGCMIAAFVVDLVLLVYIEFTRHAVEKVVAHVQPLIWFHAGVSLVVLVCYAAMVALGLQLVKGRTELRHLHRSLGIAFIVFRSLNYITSFLVV